MRIPILVLLAAALPAVAHAGPDCTELVITGHPSYPPVSWSSGRKLIGAAPDLVTRIATSLGVRKVASTDFGSWEKAQAAARGGEADVIFGIYRTEERKEFLDYLEPPFMMDPVAIVVRKGTAFPFADWKDLKGKKGVTNAGESFGDRFDPFLARELTVARVPGVAAVFTALLDGKADYAIMALIPGRNLARKLAILDKVEFLSREVVSAEMFVAFSRRSRCATALREGFARALQAAVAGGELKKLLEEADLEYAGK
jgi:polar amino acid transport system substrate-binding protein